MEIRNRSTGDVIQSDSLKALHPNTSFPSPLSVDVLDSFGYDPVFNGPSIQVTSQYGMPVRDGVVEVDGQWFTRFIEGPVFTDITDADGIVTTAAEQTASYRSQLDEQQAVTVRRQRTELLAESDWTQLPDAPVDQSQWSAYRQALRDISNQGFPWDIVWPDAPN